MKIEKPHTPKFKERLNKIYSFLKRSNSVSKEDMCKELGWEYNTSNDRRIREIISVIAQRFPIISTSDEKGYKLVKSIEDAEGVKHQWAELSSRIEELQKRINPLIKWCDDNKVNLVT